MASDKRTGEPDAITGDAIDARLSYLDFSEEDYYNLEIIHRLVDSHLEEIISDFYTHLGSFAGLDRFLSNPETVAHLAKTQLEYLRTLGLDLDSEEYFADRKRIGNTHERIGLKQEWYLGAYVKLFELIAGKLFQGGVKPERGPLALLTTLYRVITLDSTLGVESYYDATKERLETLLAELSRAQKELEATAREDVLTGVSNRRYLYESLEMEIYRSRRFKHPFALLFLDIDHFKLINDRYGHLFGDHALRRVAEIIRESVRPSNVVGRYGGEEFAIGLVECTLEDAREVADRLRMRVELSTIVHDDQKTSLTVSIGLTDLRGEDDTLECLIKRADEALYRAKEGGRNCVRVADS